MLSEEHKRPVWESGPTELISNAVRARPGICIFETYYSCVYDETETVLEEGFDSECLKSTLETSTERFVFVFVHIGPRRAPRVKHLSVLVFDTVEKSAWYVDPDRVLEQVSSLAEDLVVHCSYEWNGALGLDANMDGDCVPASFTFAYAIRDLGGVPVAVNTFASLGQDLREVYDEFYTTCVK